VSRPKPSFEIGLGVDVLRFGPAMRLGALVSVVASNHSSLLKWQQAPKIRKSIVARLDAFASRAASDR